MAYKNHKTLNLVNIIGNYENFLEKVFHEMEKRNFDFKDFVQLDHICYRTNSTESYEAKKKELSSIGTLIAETEINGRPIATFRLLHPIRYGPWRIDAIELPSPKPDIAYNEGLEHIEFVLFDDLETFLKKYSAQNFNLEAMHRGINPAISLSFGIHSVKFHLLGLLSVVYLEHKLGIVEAPN